LTDLTTQTERENLCRRGIGGKIVDTLSRREFLSRALLAGAGAVFVAPASARASAVPQDPDSFDTDPGFLAGQVVDIATSGDLAILDLDSKVRLARLGTDSGVWKLGQWSLQPPSIGDCLYVRGELAADAILYVRRAWANIDSLAGETLEVTSSGATVRSRDDSELHLAVTDETELIVPGVGVRPSLSDLHEGDLVQVIAYHQADEIVATRIFVAPQDFAGTAAAGSVGDAESLQVAATCIRKGLTTWFCCGNVSGCGRCSGSSGPGACTGTGGCRSDRLHMAWPKLGTGCGPFCSNCCLGADFERLACYTSVTVKNPCNNNSVTVRIRDCGPTIRCVDPMTCKSRTKIMFDLTPCAFSAIGNLDAGIIACNATFTC
jgi:hypothetical protein